MNRKSQLTVGLTAGALLLSSGAMATTINTTYQIGGSSGARDAGWGEIMTDWQDVTGPVGTYSSIVTDPIDLGNGVSIILRATTDNAWDITADNVNLGVRSGLDGDDNDRIDQLEGGTEYIELSVDSITGPLSNLTALSISSIVIGNINQSTETADVADGTNTQTLDENTSDYTFSTGYTSLEPLSLSNYTTWTFRVTPEDTAANANIRFNDTIIEATTIPEPSSLALLGLSGLSVLRRRRDRCD